MYRCADGKFRYIYKITCLEGSWKGKFYYGQHTTDYLADGYFSSGIKIKKYRKKYPHGYLREIISFHDSLESLNKAEYDIIHPWLNNDMCLNLKEGGGNNPYSEESKKKMSLIKKCPHPWNVGFTGRQHTEESRKKTSESTKGEKNGMYGKHHTDLTKQKQSEARKGKSPSNKGKHKVYDNKELNIFHYE